MLVWLAKYTLPYLYIAYVRFVWLTSKVEDNTYIAREALDHPPYKIAAAVWHQDVFCVAWAYRHYKPFTLASVGDAGEIITAILKLCNFTVLRGGSSKGKKRHVEVLPQMVAYMQNNRGTLGITVDGSFGPPYRLKRGVLVAAKECGSKIYIARVWCKRKILLPTWDKTVIPLPFNHIVVATVGPYSVPEGLDNTENFEKFRLFLEDELLQLTYKTFFRVGDEPPAELLALFPPGWQPRCITKD